MIAPPAWKDIEESPQYQGMSTPQKRAAFVRWDSESRDLAKEQGLWDDNEFRSAYETKAHDTLSSLHKLGGLGQTLEEGATNSYNVVRNIGNSLRRGWLQGDVANEMQKPEPSLDYIAQQQKLADSLPPSEDFTKAWSEDPNEKGSWDAFKRDPVGNLGQLLAQSMGSTFNTTFRQRSAEKLAERGAQGAIGGTAIGSAVPGIGSAAGAVTGTIAGLGTANAEIAQLSSYANEYAGEYINLLKQNGVDPTDKDQLKKAFANKEFMLSLREQANKKAVPIAVVDGLSAALGGRLFTGPAKTIAKKAMQWAGEVGVQSVFGGAGEIAGQVAQKGKVESWKSVAAEMIAEPVSSVVTEVLPGKLSQALAEPAQQAKIDAVRTIAAGLEQAGAPITAKVIAKEGAQGIVNDAIQSDQSLIEDFLEEEDDSDIDLTDKTLGDSQYAPATEAVVNATKVATDVVKAADTPVVDALADSADTHNKLFAKLEQGDLTVEGKPHKVLSEAYPAYKSGEIKDAASLQSWINTKSSLAPKPAVEAKAEPAAAQPTKKQAFTFTAGQDVIVDGQTAGVVRSVSDDGTVIVAQQVAPNKTNIIAVDPLQSKVEVVQTTTPTTAAKAAPATKALPTTETVTTAQPVATEAQITPTTYETTTPTTAVKTAQAVAAGGPATVPQVVPVEQAGIPTTQPGPAIEQAGISAGVKPAAEPVTKLAEVSRPKLTRIESFVQKNENDTFENIANKWNAANPTKQITPARVEQAADSLIKKTTAQPAAEPKVGKWKVEPGHRVSLNSKEAGQYKWAAFEHGYQGATAKGFDTKKEAEAYAKSQNERAKNEAEQKAKTTEQPVETAKAEPAKTKAEPAVKTEAAKEEEPPTPVTKSHTEAIHAAPSVKIKAASGITAVRVTDSKGRQSVELIKNVNKGRNVFHEAGPFTKVEVGVKDGKGNFVPAKTDFTIEEGPEIKGTEAEPAVVTKKVSKTKENRKAKTQKALTKDTTPDPYDGAPLNHNEASSVEETAENLDQLEEIGVLDDDATAQSVMQHLIDNKNTPRWAKLIAQTLQKIGVTDLTIEASYRPDSSWAGLYDGPRNRILINTAMMKSGNLTHIILHEAAHHVTLGKIRGKFDLSAIEQDAIKNLQDVVDELSKMPQFADDYGLRNVAEFVAEVFSNSAFRNKLNSLDIGKVSIWNRVVNAIATLFNDQHVNRGSALEYAMQQALDLAGDSVVERPTTTAAYGGTLHTIAESAWRAGYNNNNDELQQLHQRNPAMRNELNQAYGLGVRKAREQAAPLAIWDVAQQEIGSADTSINAKQLPAVFKFVSWVSGTTNADIGGGRFENATEFLKEKGVTNYVFDPFNRSKEHNNAVVEKIAGGQTDTSTVANVLNVIKESSARDQVIRQAADAVKQEGTAYFKIYEGNKDSKGAVTPKGWQEHRKAETYIPEIQKYFSNVTRKADILIAVNPIKEGQPAQGSAIAQSDSAALFDKEATPEARALAAAQLLRDTETIAPLSLDESKPLTPEQGKLISDNLDLASKIANNFKNIPLTGHEERQSEARLGLIKAGIAYDPAKNDNFRNYAVRIIKNTLTDLFRKKTRQQAREVSSSVAIGEEGTETFQDTFTEEEVTPEPDAGALKIINDIRESLSARDQKILNDFSTGMALRDVADLHNMSHEGVRKIIKRAGQQIIEALESAGITDIDNIFPPVERRQPATAKRAVSPEDEQADISEKAVGKLEAEDTKITQALKDAQDPETPGVFHFGDQDLIAPLPSFHGTKHKIKDRLDTKYIGSGEGTQAYGWGLYSAQRLGVAKGYQQTAEGWVVDGETVIPRSNSVEASALNNVAELGYEGALHGVQTTLDRHNKLEEKKVAAGIKTGKERDRSREGWEAEIEEIKKLKGKEVKRNKGNLYKLEIIPESEDLLDWDKPLSEQSDKVKGILKKLGVTGDHRTGEEIYQASLRYEGEDFEATTLTDEQISKKLDAAGIPGLRFLDRGSRFKRTQEQIDKEIKIAENQIEDYQADLETKGLSESLLKVYREEIYYQQLKVAKLKTEKPGEGTHNYVMFDGKYIEILEENGKPVGTVSEADIAAVSLEGQPTKTPWFKQKTGPYKALGKLTSAGGKWSQELYTALKIKTQKARAAFVNSVMLGNQLERLYKKHYPNGITKAERQTINTALGNVENIYTDEQWAEAKKISDPKEKAEFLLTAKLENFEQFRQKQAAALASLPDEIQNIIVEMREERNQLQRELRNRSTTSTELKYSIDDSNDLYIHRSYGIFDDPNGKWVDFVRNSSDADAQRIRANAERLFEAKARAEMAKHLMREARAAGAPITRADAIAQAQSVDVSDRVDELFTEYTEIADKGIMDTMQGKLAGQKSQSIMKLRGQIPAEVRALWGEYQDPGENFAKTASSIASFLANDEFLQTVLDDGLSKGYLARKPKDNPNWKRPEGFVKIIGDDAKSMKPLEGVYGPPMLRDAFAEMDTKTVSDWLSKTTSFVMKQKTVYSWQALARNFVGNVAIVSLNGNLLSGDGKKAITATVGNFRKLATSEKRVYIKRLIELGVISDNVGPEILKQLDQHGNLSEKEIENRLLNWVAEHKKASEFDKKAMHGIDYVLKSAEGLYSAADDIWKVYSYEAEKAKLTKALADTGTPEADIEVRSANIVRRTMPTYSEAFKASTELFRGPLGKLVAPFITFTTEIIRVFGGTIAQTADELKDNNPKIKAIGVRRMAGMMKTAAFFIAIPIISRALFDYDEDDEEAIRRGLPPWQKNARLLFLPRINGKPQFIDVSYLNPYNYISDPIQAASRGDAGGAALELVNPFKGEQLALAAMVDVSRNMKANGSQVYNPADTPETKAEKVVQHLWKTFQPGVYTSGERIYKGATGYVEESGRTYNATRELLAAATGQRLQEYDPEQTLKFQATRFGRDRRNAAQIFNDKYLTKSSTSSGEIAKAYISANRAEKEAIKNLHLDYEAAKQLGVDKRKAEAILKAGNVGQEAIKRAKTGIYKRFEPSADTLNSIKKDPERKGRYQEFLKAFSQEPKTEPLK